MNGPSLIARYRITIDLTVDARLWLANARGQWYDQGEGSVFLLEWQERWIEIIDDEVDRQVRQYVRDANLGEVWEISAKGGPSGTGSWWHEVLVYASVAYTAIKTTSELPSIIDGLRKLTRKIRRALRPSIDEEVTKALREFHPTESAGARLNQPVSSVHVKSDLSPLIAVTRRTETRMSHVAVSFDRESLSVENLGDHAMTSLEIRFSPSQGWDARIASRAVFFARCARLSGRQTLAKGLAEFMNVEGERFDLATFPGRELFCSVAYDAGVFICSFTL